MSTWTLGVVSLGVLSLGRRASVRWPAAWAMTAALLMLMPPIGLTVSVAIGLFGQHARMRRRRLQSDRARAELRLLAHGIAVSVSAGLGLVRALDIVGLRLRTNLADEVASVMHSAVRLGIGQALATAEGLAAPLFRQLAVAHLSGAAVGPAVASYAAELQAQRTSLAVQRARQLPVRMLIPLSLLMLPGFVLVVIGPTVVTSLATLVDSLGP